MIDEFGEFSANLMTPASASEVIVPSDTAILDYATRAVFVGSAGDLRVTMLSGDVVTLVNVSAGTIYPIRIKGVMATGTTAGGLVGLR